MTRKLGLFSNFCVLWWQNFPNFFSYLVKLAGPCPKFCLQTWCEVQAPRTSLSGSTPWGTSNVDIFIGFSQHKNSYIWQSCDSLKITQSPSKINAHSLNLNLHDQFVISTMLSNLLSSPKQPKYCHWFANRSPKFVAMSPIALFRFRWIEKFPVCFQNKKPLIMRSIIL